MLLTGVILILAIFAVIGWRKGVIRLVLSLVSMIVTILAAVIIAPLATTAIRNETNIDENMAQSIYTILSGRLILSPTSIIALLIFCKCSPA